MTLESSQNAMTSHCFQLLSDQEVVDLKRSKGIMACAECQRRKLKCDKKFPCTSCVRRGRADICPTGDMGPIGRGRRVIRYESLELSTTIHTMGDRIQELETAVAAAHAEESESPHPLLRDDLLAIKSSAELPRSSSGSSTPAQLSDTFGALAVSASGTSRYFGPTAGPSAFLSAQGSDGGDRAEFASPFADVTASFPFDNDYSTSWNTAQCFETLLQHLPDELRAWVLMEIFVADASWYGTPILPDELRELLTHVYASRLHSYELSPHALSLIFFVFALATLADLSLPAYSAEADVYFDLGRTALSLQSIFGSTDLHTIQALILAGLYYATGGPRYSVDSSWTLTAMAVSLCQRVRIHREGTHAGLENKIAQRQRALFWEVYSLETYCALSFSRPLSIPLADINCEFPADTEQTMDSEGRTIPGCPCSPPVNFVYAHLMTVYHTKWKFTKEVTAPMAQAYSSATLPTYEEVLDLDRRLRQFMEFAPFDHYKGSTFLAYLRTSIIPHFAGNLMLYMHRSSFVQALTDYPHKPLDSPYAASYLAAYRGASKIIQSDLRSFTLFPEQFHRWWPIWKSLVNAAFIAASIVVKSPTSELAPPAFRELLAAVELVEQGAVHAFVAQGSLPLLLRLRNKAKCVYAAFYPPGVDSALSTSPSELADEGDFEMLGGSRAFLDRASVSKSPSSSLPNSVHPSPPDLWQSEISEPYESHFEFDAVMGSEQHASETVVDGLEAYLAAQMQSTDAHFPYSHAVPETDWAAFIN
ncbi:fungal-specific transcription factor domain-containing protein [Mycena galericulata]|nr:fungal-specific transcription factor domain-containing protein [Mycena galericulata]